MNDIDKVIQKIEELIPTAPSSWAEIISERMGKSTTMIRNYASGEKGLRTNGPIEVLRHLKAIIKERKEIIEKLTA